MVLGNGSGSQSAEKGYGGGERVLPFRTKNKVQGIYVQNHPINTIYSTKVNLPNLLGPSLPRLHFALSSFLWSFS